VFSPTKRKKCTCTTCEIITTTAAAPLTPARLSK
jgi:hypothetical protein